VPSTQLAGSSSELGRDGYALEQAELRHVEGRLLLVRAGEADEVIEHLGDPDGRERCVAAVQHGLDRRGGGLAAE
jgi:hypothetical protein